MDRFQSAPPTASDIRALIADERDAKYFQVRTANLPFLYTRVWRAVNAVMSRQGDPVFVADKDGGSFVTRLERHGIYGFPHYDRYYVRLTRTGAESTRLTYLYLCYWRDMEAPALTLRPEQERGFMERRRDSFERKIAEELLRPMEP